MYIFCLVSLQHPQTSFHFIPGAPYKDILNFSMLIYSIEYLWTCFPLLPPLPSQRFLSQSALLRSVDEYLCSFGDDKITKKKILYVIFYLFIFFYLMKLVSYLKFSVQKTFVSKTNFKARLIKNITRVNNKSMTHFNKGNF